MELNKVWQSFIGMSSQSICLCIYWLGIEDVHKEIAMLDADHDWRKDDCKF